MMPHRGYAQIDAKQKYGQPQNDKQRPQQKAKQKHKGQRRKGKMQNNHKINVIGNTANKTSLNFSVKIFNDASLPS